MVKIPEPISAEQARFRRLKMKKLDWLHWVLIAALVGQTAYSWFDPYLYRNWGNGRLVRISRFSGEADQLTISGWRPLKPSDRYAVEAQQ